MLINENLFNCLPAGHQSLVHHQVGGGDPQVETLIYLLVCSKPRPTTPASELGQH